MFYFEQYYPTASPVMQNDEWIVVKVPISLPYTASWQNTDGQQGLIRMGDQFYNITEQKYANDTLYTVMKTNIGARDRFFALADEIKQIVDRDITESQQQKSPFTQVVKLLNQWAKVYLPFSSENLFLNPSFLIANSSKSSYISPFCSQLSYPVLTPPPEFA